jgi:hypothetical protein
MKKLLTLLVFILVVAGCAPVAAPPPRERIDVNPFFDGSANGQPMVFGNNAFRHSDDDLDLTLSFGLSTNLLGGSEVGPSRLNIQLVNNSDDRILIIWDESTLTFTNGGTSRIAHQGVRYSEANASQPPSVIPPGARVDDFIIASDNVTFFSGRWIEFPIVLSAPIPNETTLRLYLTLEVNGERRPYDILFRANSRAPGTPG